MTALTCAVIASLLQIHAGREGMAKAELLVAAREAVAFHALADHMPANRAALESNLGELLRRIDATAKTPEDRLRDAIVHGEIEGPDAAKSRLSNLAQAFPEMKSDIDTALSIYDTGNKPGNWDAFHDKYAWFADLALASGKPSGNPVRDTIVESAIRTFAGAVAMILLAGAGGLVGLGLAITAIVLWVKHRIHRAFQTVSPETGTPADRGVYSQAFAGYLLGIIFLGFFLRYVLHLPVALVAVLEYLVAVTWGVAWPFLRGQSWRQWRAATGFHLGRGFFREIFSGLAAYLAGVPLLVITGIIVIILSRVTGINASHPITEELGGGPVIVVALLFLACVWAPVTEELMFRGALFSHLRERFGWWISAPIVATIFAIIHPQGLIGWPILFAIALILAAIREWRGSLIGCIAAHSLNNTIAMVISLLVMG